MSLSTRLRPVSLASFRAAMRRLAAGVSLVTICEAGQRHGFAATSVTSLSGEPPSLLVCINRQTSGHDPLHRAGRFCVNLLGQESQALAAVFSDPSRRQERFGAGRWRGRDLLALEDALAVCECTVVQAIAYGTHTIVIGAINAIALHPEPRAPLIYFEASFRSLA